MSFASGTFSINSAGQPVVTGTVISSTAFNTLTADLATGLSTCMLKDGTQTLTGNIPFGTFKATGLGAPTTNGDALRWATGTFTASLTGCTTVPTAAAVYSIMGDVVNLYIPGMNGTSNTTAMTITGAPSAIIPVTVHSVFSFAGTDNSAVLTNPARADITGGTGVIALYSTFSGAGWTSSNTKGISADFTMTYKLN